MAAAAPNPGPLFGVLPSGQPLITNPASQPGEASFLYTIPNTTTTTTITTPDQQQKKPSVSIAVFLLPGISLPPGTAAAIYLALNPAALLSGTEAPQFRFLGGVGPGKESTIFKLSPGGGASSDGFVIGINVEEAGSVAERITANQQQQQAAAGGQGGQGQGQGQQPTTQVLAQRIIQNAYNFLSSFSGQVGPGGVEVVPLKAFQEWWKKFEGRVRSDPTFLERPQE